MDPIKNKDEPTQETIKKDNVNKLVQLKMRDSDTLITGVTSLKC
jgi:hypothetical protein